MQRAAKKRIDAYVAAGTELVKCKICGFPGKDLTSHIGQFHMMPVAEYKKKFSCGTESVSVPEYVVGQSKRFSGANNPGFQHNGKLSVYSKNNAHFCEDDKQKAIEKNSVSCKTNGNHSTTLQYWRNLGFDEETATKERSARQVTFSLALCIEKHGEEEGRKIWQERQTKWLKSYPFSNYSQVSQKLFWAIQQQIGEMYGPIRFAEWNPVTQQKETEAINHEEVLALNGKSIKPDFLVIDRFVVIEFDGDYWHQRDSVMDDTTNKSRSETRDQVLIEAGYRVFHVKERDYRANPENTAKMCIEFISNEN